MIIKSVELNNFRNYDTLHINFDKGTNILYGNNAQGKTNLLESIFLSGTTKSHKSSKDKEMIRFGEKESHIRTIVEKSDQEYQIDIHLKKNSTKGVAINKIPIKKASEIFGILNIVFFSPEDLNIIKSGPSERRRFLDTELCQLDKIYLYNLIKYNKILNQRNKLLKEISFHPDFEDMLSIWDIQLINYGKKIITDRKNFIKKLSNIIFDIHMKISGDKEELYLKYEPNVIESEFEYKLAESRSKDFKLRQTTVGPHRDDLLFLIFDVDIRKYGSQGQQKTSALSLKLSEIELVKEISKETPVLLLDDVLSELDHNRQNFLLNNINNIQTIVTCTGLDEFIKNRFRIDKIYQVMEGTICTNNEDFKIKK